MTSGSPAPFALASVLALGCSSEQTQIGTGEPFRVTAPDKSPPAQFIQGKLPGTPPPEKPMGPPKPPPDGGADSGVVGPPRVDFTTAGSVYQGQGSVGINGTATENAYSAGLALDGIGTGYWVVPVGDVDPLPPHLRTWTVSFDVDVSVPAGFRKLLAVAFDEQGRAGQQSSQRICIRSRVPDNFNSCDPSNPRNAPPQAVISLTWDTNADLDLQVQAPDGRLIESKDPLAHAPPPDGGPLPKKPDGIDRDSNAGCVIDGLRMENLVWWNEAPHGTHLIYVNMFSACGQPATRFRVEVYKSTDTEDGGKRLTRTYPRPEDPQGGELLDISANGGAARGLYVTSYGFN